MTSLTDVFFTLQFLVAITILVAKIINVSSNGETYQFKWAALGFGGYLLAWLLGFIAFASDLEIVLYAALFQLESWLMVLVLVLFVVEIFFLLRDLSTGKIKPQMSREQRGV